MGNKRHPVTAAILLVDRALIQFEKAVSFAAYTAMTVIVIIGIILRFVLKIPNPYGEEASKYLMILAVYMGSAMCVRKRKHLGLEFFVQKLPTKLSHSVKMITDVIVCVAYVWLSILTIQYTQTGIRLPQLSPAMRIPIWIMYGVVALGFTLCAVHAISLFWSDYLTKDHPLDWNDTTELEGGEIS